MLIANIVFMIRRPAAAAVFIAMKKKILDAILKAYTAGYTAGYKEAMQSYERLCKDLLSRDAVDPDPDRVQKEKDIL